MSSVEALSVKWWQTDPALLSPPFLLSTCPMFLSWLKALNVLYAESKVGGDGEKKESWKLGMQVAERACNCASLFLSVFAFCSFICLFFVIFFQFPQMFTVSFFHLLFLIHSLTFVSDPFFLFFFSTSSLPSYSLVWKGNGKATFLIYFIELYVGLHYHTR